MKKIFLLSCLLIWPLSVSATPSHTAFDDDNFYNCVVEKYKSDHPLEGITDILTDVQLQAITELMCISKNISSVKGIEKLTNLESLSLGNNNISSIDLKSNSQLNSLYLDRNNISLIDLSNNKNLQYLNLEDNDLIEINIDANIALKELSVVNNELSHLNLANNQELTSLFASNNKITNIDLKNNSKLKNVNLDYNNITNINFSNNLDLEQIDLSNNSLTSINLNLAKVKRIKIVNNSLTKFSINCPQLEMLDISNNHILTCDFSKLNNLKSGSSFELGFSNFQGEIPTTITPQAKALTVYNGKLDLKEYDSNFNPSKVVFTPIDGVTYDSKTGIFTFTKEVENISYIYKNNNILLFIKKYILHKIFSKGKMK